MIKKPTVLVLGAVASMDFVFPSGYGLYSMITGSPYHTKMYGKIKSALGDIGLARRFLEFATVLKHSGKTSVDAFLEHRPDYMEIGKLAMAAALLHSESEHKLFETEEGAETWYQYLFKAMNAKLAVF